MKTILDSLRQTGLSKVFAAGESLFVEGQEDARVFLVESGSIEIGLGSRNGQGLTLNVLGPGEVFGEIAMLDGGPRTANAVARVDSRVACLDRKQFFSLFASQHEAYEFVVQHLCQRLRWINRHTERIPLSTARVLLASRLLMIGDEESTDWIRTSEQEMADRVGLTREYTHQLLDEWKKAGVIEKKRNAVRIAQWKELEKLADANN